MAEDKLNTLWSNLKKDGYDLPEYSTFRNDMSNPDNLKKFHATLTNDGYELPELSVFESDMGLKKKEVSGTSSNTFSNPFSDLAQRKEVNLQPPIRKGTGDILRPVTANAGLSLPSPDKLVDKNAEDMSRYESGLDYAKQQELPENVTQSTFKSPVLEKQKRDVFENQLGQSTDLNDPVQLSNTIFTQMGGTEQEKEYFAKYGPELSEYFDKLPDESYAYWKTIAKSGQVSEKDRYNLMAGVIGMRITNADRDLPILEKQIQDLVAAGDMTGAQLAQDQFKFVLEQRNEAAADAMGIIQAFPKMYEEYMSRSLREAIYSAVKNTEVGQQVRFMLQTEKAVKEIYNKVPSILNSVGQLALTVNTLGQVPPDLKTQASKGLEDAFGSIKFDTIRTPVYNEKTGEFDPMALIGTAVPELAGMVMLGAGGRAINAAAGLAGGSRIGLFASTYIYTYGDNIAAAREAGILDPTDQVLYATTASALEAALEGIVPENRLLDFRRQAIENYVTVLKTEGRQAAIRSLGEFTKVTVKSMGAQISEEVLQDISNTVVNTVSNSLSPQAQLDDAYTLSEFINTITISGVVSLIGAGASNSSLLGSPNRVAMGKYLASLPEGKLESVMSEMIASKQLTEQQAADITQQVEKVKAISASIPKTVSEAKSNKATPWMNKRNELEEEAKNLAKPFADAIKEKIAVIDEEVLRITGQQVPEEVAGEKSEKQIVEEKRKKQLLDELKAEVEPKEPEVINTGGDNITPKQFTQGVKNVFKTNPKLAEIADSKQYEQYVASVFPDTQVKGVLYHGSTKQFSDFKPGMKYKNETGFHFTPDEGLAKEFGENVYPVVLDIKNLKEVPDLTVWSDANFREKLGMSRRKFLQQYDGVKYVNLHEFSPSNTKIFSGVLTRELWEQANEIAPGYLMEESIGRHFNGLPIPLRKEYSYAVFNPEQIHVLGSDKDIEKFREWSKSSSTENGPNNSQKPEGSLEGSKETGKPEGETEASTEGTSKDKGRDKATGGPVDARSKRAESFGYSGVEQAVNSVNKHTGKKYEFKDFDAIPDAELKLASARSRTVKKNKPFQETRFKQRTSDAQKRVFSDVISKLKQAFPKIDVAFEASSNGSAAAVENGVIKINPEEFRLDAPIHEYAHVWLDLAKQKYPEFYKNTTAAMYGTEYLNEAKEKYPDLSISKQLEEAAVQAIADAGVKITEKSKLAKFKSWLINLGKRIAEWMGIKKPVNLLESTWEDLASLAAQDLMAGRPISYITSAQAAKIDRTAYPVGIENGVMDTTIKGVDRFINWASGKKYSGIVQFFKDMFRPGGIAKPIKELDIKRDRKLQGFTRQIAATVGDWRDAIKEFSDSDKKLNDAIDKVNGFLTQGQPIESVPESLRSVAKRMRDEVDGLSQLLIDSGFIEDGSDLHASISQNLGVYMNRSYAAFSDQSWNERMFPEGARGKGARGAKMEARYERAFNYIKDKYENFVELDGELYTFKVNELGDITEAYDSYGDTITDEATIEDIASAASEKESVTDDEVNQILKGIAKEGKDLKNPNAGKIGKLALGMFKKRKDVPEEIRQFLGEYENPESRYINSVSKMADFLENKAFLTQLRNLGEGKIFFDKPTGEYDRLIASTDEYSPLSSAKKPMYTSDEIYNVFLKDKPAQSSFGRFAAVLNVLVKGGKTILSPGAQARNFISNFLVTESNGYWTPFFLFDKTKGKQVGYIAAFRESIREFNERPDSTLRELAELGVINNSAVGRDMQEALKRAFSSEKDSPVKEDPTGSISEYIEAMTGRKEVVDALKKGGDFASKLYMFGDNVHKIFNWYAELSQVKYMFPEMGAEAQKRKAQERFMATNVNYDKVPKIVEAIRRNPFFGAFPSWPAEIMRISFNIPVLAAEDIKQGIKEKNNRQLAVGANRMLGFISVAVASQAIPSIISRIWGGSDEDDERLLEIQAPSFSKNTQRIILDVDGTKIKFMDWSWQNPYSIHGKALTTFLNTKDENGKLVAFGEMLMTYLDPFISEEILVSTLQELRANKDPNGREIYNEEDQFGNKSSDVSAYIWNKLQPGITAQSEKIYKSLIDREENGRAYNTADELLGVFTGFRIYELDVLDRLKSIAYKYNGYFEQDEQIYRREFYKKTNDPEQPKKVEDAYKRANDIYRKRQEELIEYISLLRRKGVDDKEIKERLKPIQMSGILKTIMREEVVDLKVIKPKE
jgi:hypothetical protein